MLCALQPGPSTSQRSSSNPDTEVDLEMDEEAISGPFIPDPMLCSEAEEGKVPHSLELLHHGSQSRSSNDCLMVALHLIMLETGFLPQVRISSALFTADGKNNQDSLEE